VSESSVVIINTNQQFEFIMGLNMALFVIVSLPQLNGIILSRCYQIFVLCHFAGAVASHTPFNLDQYFPASKISYLLCLIQVNITVFNT